MRADGARTRAWRGAVAAALAALALLGTAAAQSYAIEQAGHALGSFDVVLQQGADGAVSDSTLELTGLASLTDHLVTDTSGHAISYRLDGTAHGAPVTVTVQFESAQASFAIDQAGRKQTLSVPLGGPVAVIDNSMLDGWQILAHQLDPHAAGPQVFDVLVPQAALAGSVTFTAAGEHDVDVAGTKVRAVRYDAVLGVGGQHVGVTLWLDGSGTIVLFEQPSASLRYVLQTPASKEAASAAAKNEAAGLAARMADQERCVSEREMRVVSTGETLVGTLSVPTGTATQGWRRPPALLLLPGSGAVDRQGNAPPLVTNSMYQQLAYALGCRGFAVLRIDKLGIGASSGNGNAVTLQTYAQNTADWVALLRQQPDLDPRRIGLMGHSEGGLIALYAVARGDVTPATVVLLESPGLPMGTVIEDQLVGQARARGAPEAEVAQRASQVREALRAIEASTTVALPLQGDLAKNPIAVAFAHAAGLLRSELEQDPAALAAAIHLPMLVVQGGKDVQVAPVNGETLARSAPDATYLLLPELEHDLYTTSGPAIEKVLPDAGTQVAGSLVDAVASYLLGHLVAAP